MAAFVDNAIFAAARPHGITLVAGGCNRQAAFAVYQPDGVQQMALAGLQVLEIHERLGQAIITSITSYRDPQLASRCGFSLLME